MKFRYGRYIVVGAYFFLLIGRADAAPVQTAVKVVVVPNAPSSLTATPDAATQVTISWTDNSGGTEDGFSIERKLGSTGAYAVIGTTATGIATYVDNTTAADTTYFYRVQAFTGSESSAYSNEASVTTPDASSGGGGGGGGGGGTSGGGGSGGGGGGGSYVPPPTFQTSAIFRGIAYPASKISLLENGQVVASTQAGPDAKFEIDLSDIAPGTYTFGIWAGDSNGNRSIVQTFSVMLTNGATTIISGIFFAPTIGLDKTEVKQGDPLTVLGYGAPGASISVVINSTNEMVGNVTSSDSGAWSYEVSTEGLEYGNHTAHANEALGGSFTTNSDLVNFTVGDEDIEAPTTTGCPAAGDLNGDCAVNLVDFSIMAYWYERPDPPMGIDLNHDGKIDLTDFSILAYYWTG